MRLIDADVLLDEITELAKLFPFTDRTIKARTSRGLLFAFRELINDQPTITPEAGKEK